VGRSVSVTTTDAAAAADTLTRLGLRDVRVEEGVVRGLLADIAPEEVGPALVRGEVPFTGLQVARPGLEEFFVGLTGEGFDVAG
jgi:ABC-2 type transport system ATP-binding protein